MGDNDYRGPFINPLESTITGRNQKNMKNNRIILAAGALIVLIVAGLIFQPWLYFVNNEVDEAFPGLTSAQRDEIRNMPEDQRTTLVEMAETNQEMAEETALAQMEEPVTVPDADQAMPDNMPEEPVILAAGSFIQIDPVHGAEGTATIYELTDGSRVLRFENFRSTNGPDLHVYLSKETPTSTFGSLGADAIDLGALKGNVGSQNYEIPADIDLAEYQSIVIYCVPFSVVFSSAALGG